MLLSYIVDQARHSQDSPKHLPRPKNALHDKQVLAETSEPGNKGGLGGVGGGGAVVPKLVAFL